METKPTRQPTVVEMPAWGVRVFESHHAADFRMTVSRHEAVEVFYVLGGAGVFELEGRPVPCLAGDVVVVPINHRHRIEDDRKKPFSLYGVRLHPQVWRWDPALGRDLPAGRLPRDKMLSLQVRAEVRRLLFEQTCCRPGYAGMMVGVALQLLALLTRVRGHGPATEPVEPGGASGLRETVEAYVAQLDRRFFEAARLDGIAKQLGMCRRRFTELFREITGASWSDYLRALRVDHSKQLLRETNRSVLSIAFESGFEDLSTFYRVFQRRVGTSPHCWRQQQLTESEHPL
jgi:AraC family L-rhamnose operon regulatory protein RhaS